MMFDYIKSIIKDNEPDYLKKRIDLYKILMWATVNFLKSNGKQASITFDEILLSAQFK